MYDFFISFKCRDNGKQTEDRAIAEELYSRLQTLGYHVFFSEQILAKDGITKYISEINQALNDARTFILVCSKKQYILSGWVAQEWSSFLNLMMTNETKKLFSYLINMKESDLPALLGPFQSFQHSNGMDKAIKYLKIATPVSPSQNAKPLSTMQAILDGEFGIFGHLKTLDINSVTHYLDKYPEMTYFIQAHYYFRQGDYTQSWDYIYKLSNLNSVKGYYLASIMHKRGCGTKRDITIAKEELKKAYIVWKNAISADSVSSEILLLVFNSGSGLFTPADYMAVCIHDILDIFGLKCTIRTIGWNSSPEMITLPKYKYVLFLSNNLAGFSRDNYDSPAIIDVLSALDKHILKLGIHNLRQINMPKPFRKFKVFELSRNGIGKYCQYLLRKNAHLIWNDKEVH